MAVLNSHWLLQTSVGGPYQMVIGGGQQYVLPSGAAAGHYCTAAAAGTAQVCKLAVTCLTGQWRLTTALLYISDWLLSLFYLTSAGVLPGLHLHVN